MKHAFYRIHMSIIDIRVDYFHTKKLRALHELFLKKGVPHQFSSG